MSASSSATGSCLVTRDVARGAIELARPLLERVAQDITINQSGVIHVVILDPAVGPGAASFEQAILHEASFGRDRSQWDADYAGFARAMAQLSCRTGFDSHVIQQLQPQRLRPGETALWGSVVLDGFVVAVSGAEPPYDEALSGVIAMLLRGITKASRARVDGTTV